MVCNVKKPNSLSFQFDCLCDAYTVISNCGGDDWYGSFFSDQEYCTCAHYCWCRSHTFNYSVYKDACQSFLMQPFLVSAYELDSRRLAIAFGCFVVGEVHALCTHTNSACERCFLCSEPIWQLINVASIRLVARKRLRRKNRRHRD